MTNPPERKTIQKDWVQTALRLPQELHAELSAAASAHGHSLNAEMLQRLDVAQHQAVMEELAEMKALIRKMIEMT